MIHLLAACAFDPSHPHAACHDTIRAPLIIIWAAIVVALFVAGVMLSRFLRRRRGPDPSNPLG